MQNIYNNFKHLYPINSSLVRENDEELLKCFFFYFGKFKLSNKYEDIVAEFNKLDIEKLILAYNNHQSWEYIRTAKIAFYLDMNNLREKMCNFLDILSLTEKKEKPLKIEETKEYEFYPPVDFEIKNKRKLEDSETERISRSLAQFDLTSENRFLISALSNVIKFVDNEKIHNQYKIFISRGLRLVQIDKDLDRLDTFENRDTHEAQILNLQNLKLKLEIWQTNNTSVLTALTHEIVSKLGGSLDMKSAVRYLNDMSTVKVVNRPQLEEIEQEQKDEMEDEE